MSRIRRPYGRQSGRSLPGWTTAQVIASANVVAAYRAIGAPTLAASYVNLANPGTYTLTASAAPTHDPTTGWTFNGSSQFLISSVVPTATTTIVVRFSDAGAGGYVAGSVNTCRFYISPLKVADPAQSQWGWGDANAALAANTSGTVALAANAAYNDGVVVASATLSAASWTGDVSAIFLGCDTANGTEPAIDSYFSGKIQAVAIYNVALSAAQVLAVHTAMMAL